LVFEFQSLQGDWNHTHGWRILATLDISLVISRASIAESEKPCTKRVKPAETPRLRRLSKYSCQKFVKPIQRMPNRIHKSMWSFLRRMAFRRPASARMRLLALLHVLLLLRVLLFHALRLLSVTLFRLLPARLVGISLHQLLVFLLLSLHQLLVFL